MLKILAKFVRDESGISTVEYGLIAAIILVATTCAVSAAGFSIADVVEAVTSL
jgi:pilus assembly protein Flp/PilA